MEPIYIVEVKRKGNRKWWVSAFASMDHTKEQARDVVDMFEGGKDHYRVSVR